MTALARRFDVILLVNLMAQVLIIVTGGLVRITGSGLGCPTWPQCVPGSYVPVQHQAQSYHKYIEFGNRTLTGVLLVAAILAVIAVWTVRKRRDLQLAAAAVLAGVVLQAVLGGITVLTELHPVTVSVHFLVSAALVAASSYLYFARDRAPRQTPAVPELVVNLAWLTAALAGVVLVLGTIVTGSGPHSGDAQTPARYGFDPRSVSWLHADSVMLFVGLVIAMVVAVRLSTQRPDTNDAWRLVLLVAIGQGAVGYTQYLTGLPGLLVIVHMFAAALLVVALTRGIVLLHRPARSCPVPVKPAP